MKIWTVDEKNAEVLIYGPIADDENWSWIDNSVGALELANSLMPLKDKDITVRINSPGGSLFAGQAMMSTLKNHKGKVTAIIDGLAASAATLVMCGADKVIMPAGSMIMIHNPLTGVIGDMHAFRKMGDVLDEIKKSVIAAYKTKSNLSDEKLSELMDEETWLTAAQAKEYGFADKVQGEIKMSIQNKIVNSNGVEMPLNAIPGQTQFLNCAQLINKKGEEKTLEAEEKGLLTKILNKLDDFINLSKDKEVKPLEGTKIELTKELLQKEYPDIYNAVLEDGVHAERSRIKEIDNISTNIPSEIVNKAKYESFSDAQTLAMDYMKSGGAFFNAVKKDIEVSGAQKVEQSLDPGEITEDEQREQIISLMVGGLK
ncbi:Clp protease ClpP [Selenomonadales bacterium OttesenSCG-928-I06]|nr:Clp protease ClpP [Selenomonadales bacterium OttesenSCG-928-I06]